jgi:3-oxoacyl-[acyl-carrier protein] reductase
MTSVSRRALVTGSSGQIGAAICRRLAEGGHFVYAQAHRGIDAAAQALCDRDRRRLAGSAAGARL